MITSRSSKSGPFTACPPTYISACGEWRSNEWQETRTCWAEGMPAGAPRCPCLGLSCPPACKHTDIHIGCVVRCEWECCFTNTHTHTHTNTHTRVRAHTHTRARTHTHLRARLRQRCSCAASRFAAPGPHQGFSSLVSSRISAAAPSLLRPALKHRRASATVRFCSPASTW